jgi:initiation factor 1A|uniref:S1-like domain-containing protein n=1 Tax=viral metagenome TaxID=1070528 RepID=A0A6C0CXB9_9ZZZZ
MVKNAKGGNKSKKMGRKFLGAPVQKQVRLADPNEPLEIYGVVDKLFGHGRFQIKDHTGKQRLVIIPNKFRGRGKRDNTVVLGGWVLVGIREYESSENAKCDLLEVYTDAEKQKLKKSSNPIFNQLKSDHDKDIVDDGEFEFSMGNESNEKYEEIIQNTETNNQNTIKFGDDEEEVDIDDI